MPRCECFDNGCPVGHGWGSEDSQCPSVATTTLFRSDFSGNPVLNFCQSCAEDALSSGLFGVEEDESR